MLTVAQAQERSRETAEVLRIAVSPDYKFDAAGRATFGDAMSAYCTAAIADLPTNTPAEQKWVDDEASTSNLDKIARLTATPEWARSQLATIYRDCRDATVKIKFAQQNAQPTYEAASWISLGITFNNDRDILQYAQIAPIDAKLHGIYFLGPIRERIMIAAKRALEESL
jgi:hypothetical protein